MSKAVRFVFLGVLCLVSGFGVGLRSLTVDAHEVRSDGSVVLVHPFEAVSCGTAWSPAVPDTATDAASQRIAADCRSAADHDQDLSTYLLGHGGGFVVVGLLFARQERRRRRESARDWADRDGRCSVTGGMTSWRSSSAATDDRTPEAAAGAAR